MQLGSAARGDAGSEGERESACAHKRAGIPVGREFIHGAALHSPPAFCTPRVGCF